VKSVVDKFLDRKLDRNSFNCLHLTRDVWLELTGEDLSERLAGLMGRLGTKKLRRATVRAFRRLDAPISPCIVIMKLPHYQPHMGVFLRGKILHIQTHGVEFLPPSLATRGFKTVRYYQ
jgi:hypothetical protein